MKQFFSFIIKETKHIVRDKRTMLMLFGMPIVMMLLFGFAVTNDVKNIRVVIVTSNSDYATQQVVNRLAASEYFKITKVVDTPAEAEQVIRAQKADMAVVFAQDFASRKSGYQLMIDATDPNMAQQWTTYANAVINNYENDIVKDLATGETTTTGLPKSNVLYFDMTDDAWFCVRPSGTEPKIKFYAGIKGNSLEDADEKLAKVLTELKKLGD